MRETAQAIKTARHIVVIQAENPDGDSLATSLALEELLGGLGKQVSLYCYVAMPKYLRYLAGWDRVESELPADFDLSIIVDASTRPLLERTLEGANLSKLTSQPCIVIDHHTTKVDLPLPTINLLDETAVSAGQIVAQLASAAKWPLNAAAATNVAASILSDSLGLSSAKTSAESIDILADMVRAGANLSELDEKRRALNRKSLDIFRYKGQLFERVELHLEGRLALVHIPWEEIERYSDTYNPSMLIIDEMRLIEGVAIAAAIKSYPDGKITVKLRSNPEAQFMHELAGRFGGGGHPFTAGFKVHGTTVEALSRELIAAAQKLLEESRA
jgi:phosphoesterase RecJ-like protein